MPSPLVITFGCRLNACESDVVAAHAGAAGLGDAFLVNTCAVTEEAVRQSAQAIRRLRRESPRARIIATGCAVQVEPQRFAAMAEVDYVIGNREKLEAATYAALAAGGAERATVGDIMAARTSIAQPLMPRPQRTRAFVQVQTGCDHRCTFCIIPYGRGASRSVPADVVVGQARGLVEAGCREVALTGVDLTSYGADLPDTPKLGHLVLQILREVPELSRLRLSSIDQVEADAELLRALAEEPRLMPHLHLSMQAGDDLVLKRMKRRHLRADAIKFCDEARRLRPDVTFGADLIAGFPTESEEMFARSLDIVDECGLTFLHVFPFSPRQGTPAARMPQVPREVVSERARRLRAAGELRLTAHLDAQRGREVVVLAERGGTGRTEDFCEMTIDRAAGSIVRMRVTGREKTRLFGEAMA